MPSTSKSKRRKPKKQWQVNKRNWLELPSDVMANILFRVSVHDILENAQKVCTSWRKICKDPSMWRVICMDYSIDLKAIYKDRAICKHAVDRSQGQLIDITIDFFVDDELLQYVADRSSQLRRLKIISSSCGNESWTKVLKKFPLLEELSFYSERTSKEAVKTIVCCCPLLKTLKLNEWSSRFSSYYLGTCDEIAITIGENLHELQHLELVGNRMSNIGLRVILDGCCHLKSLDLRRCWFINLKGDLRKRCLRQIKCLKLPNDPLKGCQYIDGSVSDSDNEYDGSVSDSDNEYDGSVSDSDNEYDGSVSDSDDEYDGTVSDSDNEYDGSVSDSDDEYDGTVSDSDNEYDGSVSDSDNEYDGTVSDSDDEYDGTVSDSDNEYDGYSSYDDYN